MKIHFPIRTLQARSAHLPIQLLIILPALMMPPSCLAQFGSDSFSAGDAGTQSRSIPITGSQTDTVYYSGPVPILQGATNGTIGPQAGDAIVIQGVNTSGYFIPGDAFDPHPTVPETRYWSEPEEGPATATTPEFTEPPTSFPSEVIREDPRQIDLPDPLDDRMRDNYCRLIVESRGKKVDPAGKADTCLQLGIAYGNMGPYQDGIQYLKRAAKLDPNCDACYYNLGTIYSNQGRYVDALKWYNKALSVKPTSRAYFHLGLTYSFIGLHSQALKTFDRALRLDPADKKIYFERAVCRMALGLHADAVTDLNAALKNSYPRPSWLFRRGLALSRTGRYEDAIADFDRALKSDDSPTYYNERGKVFVKLKEYDAALYDFNEALHRDSSFAEAYENRAQVYTELGRLGPATDDMLMAKRLADGS